MNPDQIQNLIQSIMGLLTALAAVIAAFKAGGAQKEARTAKAEAMASRLQMANPGAPGALPPGLNISDLFRYSALIQQFLAVIKGIGRLDIGQTAPVPRVVLDEPNGQQIEFPPTTATRTR